MKYSLFFLLQGQAGLWHHQVRSAILAKFGSGTFHVVSHLTLKYDVEVADAAALRELQDVLYAFQQEAPSILSERSGDDQSPDLALDDDSADDDERQATVELLPECSYFDDTLAVYLKCRISRGFTRLLANLHSGLKALPWISFSKKSPHGMQGDHFGDETESLFPVATLALSAPLGPITRDNVEDVVRFVNDFIAEEGTSQRRDVGFKLAFDHIALCPLENGQRLVSQVFYLPPLGRSGGNQVPAEDKWKCSSHAMSIPDLVGVAGSFDAQSDDAPSEDSPLPIQRDPHLTDISSILPLATLPDTAVAYRSKHVDDLIAFALRREVEGLEKFENNAFGDVYNFILQDGFRAYIYGGYLRDAFCFGTLSDDVDSLFTEPVSKMVPSFEVRGWPYGCKRDEETGQVRDDFVYVGSGKGRFSGHILGSGCEGEFSMNTLVYDLESRVLIDPIGSGIEDAMNHRLRIASHNWEEWLRVDRLLGMRLLRFENFRSRGYKHVDQKTRDWIIRRLDTLAKEAHKTPREGDGLSFALATATFFERKILVKNKDVADRKESTFRFQVIHDYNKVFGQGGSEFYQTYMIPLYPKSDKA